MEKSLFAAHPAIFREKTQFLWVNENLKMGKLVQHFFLSKKRGGEKDGGRSREKKRKEGRKQGRKAREKRRKGGREEGRMKAGRKAGRKGMVPRKICKPVSFICILSSSVIEQTGCFSQPDGSSCEGYILAVRSDWLLSGERRVFSY